MPTFNKNNAQIIIKKNGNSPVIFFWIYPRHSSCCLLAEEQTWRNSYCCIVIERDSVLACRLSVEHISPLSFCDEREILWTGPVVSHSMSNIDIFLAPSLFFVWLKFIHECVCVLHFLRINLTHNKQSIGVCLCSTLTIIYKIKETD